MKIWVDKNIPLERCFSEWTRTQGVFCLVKSEPRWPWVTLDMGETEDSRSESDMSIEIIWEVSSLMMIGGMKDMKLFGFCKQEMKHSTKMLRLTCDSQSWVALQYSLSWRLHHCLLTLNLPVCPLRSIAVRSVAKPHQPWRVYDHIWLRKNIAGMPCDR